MERWRGRGKEGGRERITHSTIDRGKMKREREEGEGRTWKF